MATFVWINEILEWITEKGQQNRNFSKICLEKLNFLKIVHEKIDIFRKFAWKNRPQISNQIDTGEANYTWITGLIARSLDKWLVDWVRFLSDTYECRVGVYEGNTQLNLQKHSTFLLNKKGSFRRLK